MSKAVDLHALGWDDEVAAGAAAEPGRPGRVVRQDRGWVQVATETGVDAFRTRADRVGTPVVGDWVTVVDDEVGAVLPRRNELRRADPVGDGAQVLAANVDRVLLVLGLDRPVKDGRVQRALVQAADADVRLIAVLTKADLVDEPEHASSELAAAHPGLDVQAVSAHRDRGIDALRGRIAGETVVLLGESGAGKSSLLNALAGDALAEIGDVRTGDAKGRHTTTRRELHLLPGGGLVADTPGVRAIGIHADPISVDEAFPDITELAAGCRFGDCTHSGEPGCAVRDAVDDDTLDAPRLDAYHELRAEAEWSVRPDHERRRR